MATDVPATDDWVWKRGDGKQEREQSERGREGERERGGNIGRYVRQEEERACMNERAGITTSYVNAVLGNPGETKKCTGARFLWQSPHTLI